MGEDSLSSRRSEEASVLQQDDDCQHNEDIGTVTYCGCFHGLWCCTWRTHSQGYDTCQEEEVKKYSYLVVKEVKKNVKALLATILEGGPKWKAILIRKLRRSSSGAKKNKTRRMQFQYDPKSYALNFDDGADKELGDDAVYLHFSARYACPLALGDVNILPSLIH